jgi:hypothetical protein
MKDCCGNCAYCEVKPKGEFHYGSNGKNEVDWHCALHKQWLGDPYGKCKDYK